MSTLPFSRKALPIAIFASLLAACNSNDNDSGASTPTPITSTITGTASKGTLINALVSAYKIKDDGTKGEKIGDTTTDINGNYTIKVTDYTGSVLLELSSNSSTKMRCDIAKGCGSGNAFGSEVSTDLKLSSVLASAAGNPKTTITPFTHIATRFANSKIGGYKKANIDSAFSQVQQIFDLPDLQNTTPADATKTLPTNLDVQRYALMNAAIGQLATNVADIQGKIDALAAALQANNGQLQSSETGTANLVIDLADVLKAATDMANSGNMPSLSSLIKTAVSQQLQIAQASTSNTNVQPTINAGADDLAKAKAFVTSVKQLATSAQDLQSLESSFTAKTKTVDTLANGNVLIGDALAAVTSILFTAIENNQTTTLDTAGVQALLDSDANDTNVQFVAATNTSMTVNPAAHTITLNGSITVKKFGESSTFAVTNFQVTYPDKNTAASTFELKISPSSTITGTDMKLSMAANADSKFSVTFPTSATLNNHLEAADLPDELSTDHIPVASTIKLDKVTITALKAPSNEFNVFEGSINFAGIQTELDTTLNQKRKTANFNTIGLVGKFTSVAGDIMEAGLTIDATGSNPRISPDEGNIRTGLYSYQYNSASNTITLKPSIGTIGWDNATQLVLTMADCGSGMKYLTANNGSVYLGYNCSTQTNVADAYKTFINSYNGYSWGLMTYINQEGEYFPDYPATFNYMSTNTTIDGVLDRSEDELSEDATHFIKATIGLTTKVKLGTSEASVNLTAKRTSYGTDGGNGEFMGDIIVGNDKLTIQSPVVGGKPMITLTNKDNVSVQANILDSEEKIEIKIGGKTAGWIYKINGLPVAKFTDNSLMAL